MRFPTSFIKATTKYTTFEEFIPAPYMRKSFYSSEETIAHLIIGSTGFYEVFLNGKRYTKGALAPYICNPDHLVYYDEYDLPLVKGENVLGLCAGNGFINHIGGHSWMFDKATYREVPSIALELSYYCGDEKISIYSDESFRVAPSPIVFDDYRYGEHYDARLNISGWSLPGFDDSNWNNALPAVQPLGEKRICTAEPITVQKELKPISITKQKDGYVYDFGVNLAGVCRLNIKGEAGQQIDLLHGEYLIDGIPDIWNIWSKTEYAEWDEKMVHRDIYICSGEGKETYTPTFTYHGFQYVYVTGITEEQATEDLLTYLVMNSNIKVRGDFYCSNPTANYLQQITRNSDLANFYYFPTDCPHREKNGWTADAALSSEHMLLNLEPDKSFAEWMQSICKAQAHSGSLPGIVPTAFWGFNWGNGPAWDSVLVYLPYYIYIYRGDLSLARDSAQNFIRYLKYINSRRDEKGLIHFGLGDWCQPGVSEDKYDTPLEFTDTVISKDIADKSALLFKELGLKEEQQYAENFSSELRASVRKHLININTLIAAGNHQTSQAMSLFYNIFEPDEEPKAFENLLEMIDAADGHFTTGILGGRVIFHVLSKFGRSDLAFNMITRPDYPSYGNWVARGATSLWEDFRKEGDRVNSRNHHFWGDISSWFIRNLAGIKLNPNKCNVNEVEISPSFIHQLSSASAYHIAPLGKISVEWKRINKKEIELTLEIPEKMDASLVTDEYRIQNNKNTANITSGVYILRKIN